MPVTIVIQDNSGTDLHLEESGGITVESATAPGPQGPAGPQGPEGPPGPQGPEGPTDSGAMGYVNHGADDNVARPTGYAAVYWVGSVLPINMANGDTWVNTV